MKTCGATCSICHAPAALSNIMQTPVSIADRPVTTLTWSFLYLQETTEFLETMITIQRPFSWLN